MSSGTFHEKLESLQNISLGKVGPEIEQVVDDLFVGLLTDVQQRLQASVHDESASQQALDELFHALRDRKLNSSPDEWNRFVVLCRRHPLMQLVHQDPFTFRAFSKPRGYAGDALMMDFIYGREEFWSPPQADPIGQRVFDFTTSAPASEGVRARRAFVASCIDRLAEERSRPHILSIASGHLREVNLSAAIRRRRTGRVVALDADAQSLEEVRRSYACFGVETVLGSFRRLLSNKRGGDRFDLVYSTGLLDYLTQPVARKLTAQMFQMLRSGGSLVVANFLPGIRDVGYMEAYMDWQLIYRTRQEMVDLTADLPECDVRQVTTFSEEQRNIIFLQVTKQ